MHTILRASRKGFTLIEMMIVLAMIGILASMLYPSFQSYMERSHDVESQIAMRNVISLMKQYLAENGDELVSEPAQIMNDEELYYTDGIPSEWGWGSSFSKHTNLDKFFKTGDGPKILANTNVMGAVKNGEPAFIISKFSYKTYFDGGYIIPGKDGTSTKKIPSVSWRFYSSTKFPGFADEYYTPVIGSNLSEFNKKCSPGIAMYLYTSEAYSTHELTCQYFFE